MVDSTVRRESGWFRKKGRIIKIIALPLCSQFSEGGCRQLRLLGRHLNQY
jgi:hypothetical protein